MKTQKTRNKKATYVQLIKNAIGYVVKQITHQRVGSFGGTNLNMKNNSNLCSNRTEKRKLERNRSFLVWDSGRLGTYVYAKHGELSIN